MAQPGLEVLENPVSQPPDRPSLHLEGWKGNVNLSDWVVVDRASLWVGDDLQGGP